MAVEPVSLLYSKPSKPTQAHGKLLPLNTPSRQENPSPEAAGPTPEAAAGRSAEGDLEVGFEKIYKYLSSISHSGHGPELSPAESAVVLRRRETQPPAPIEVWVDLAKKVTGPPEEALTVAFSQALTIMAVEPVSLLYSKPSKPTQAHGKLLPLNTPSRQENPSPEAAGPTPEAAAGPSAEGDLEVDFEKIYKYLSSISHSGHGPELSPAESAVVLHLLMSLPEELSHLPCAALVEHMMDTYLHLMAPQSAPSGGNLGPGAEVCGTGSRAI
ncbi:snRNA-activating protein complex subunit 2 [Myotis brandtii]|uniref:snRNA-activating protein complex subunit 2 n=1 Tax=Myotis brandtii TaxID=109478 RepID=S7PG42_MYOBR|nr:snRNA-activating protein complex subunit 2 [Myotis brandtii]